jgi:TusA-related sulfurtransferase
MASKGQLQTILMEKYGINKNISAALNKEECEQIIEILDNEPITVKLIESFAEKNNLDPHVRLLVPNSGSKLDKNTLLNTPPDNTLETVSYRQANIKRFQFNKSKLKKG